MLLVVYSTSPHRYFAIGTPPAPITARPGDRLEAVEVALGAQYPIMSWTPSSVTVCVPSTWTRPGGRWYRACELVGWRLDPLKTPFSGLILPGDVAILYHGTTRAAAESILANGFKLPTCSHDESGCKCGMMGACVYLARRKKAEDFSSRYPDYTPRPDGVVIEVLVRTIGIIVKGPEPCSCGCEQPFVDHHGEWYKRPDAPPAVWLQDRSFPACRSAELAVRDLNILKPVRMYEVGDVPSRPVPDKILHGRK